MRRTCFPPSHLAFSLSLLSSFFLSSRPRSFFPCPTAGLLFSFPRKRNCTYSPSPRFFPLLPLRLKVKLFPFFAAVDGSFSPLGDSFTFFCYVGLFFFFLLPTCWSLGKPILPPVSGRFPPLRPFFFNFFFFFPSSFPLVVNRLSFIPSFRLMNLACPLALSVVCQRPLFSS